MKSLITAICAVAGMLGTVGSSAAATVTLDFSDNPFSITNLSAYSQYNIDASANGYFHEKYGVEFTNAYLFYSVPSSTAAVNGFGLANGLVSQNYVRSTVGRVSFTDATSFLTFDYVALLKTTFVAFASDGTELARYTATPADADHVASGTETFRSERGPIAYLTFTSTGGFGTINHLSYNFDGKNNPPVPEPQVWVLVLAGLLGGSALTKRQRR